MNTIHIEKQVRYSMQFFFLLIGPSCSKDAVQAAADLTTDSATSCLAPTGSSGHSSLQTRGEDDLLQNIAFIKRVIATIEKGKPFYPLGSDSLHALQLAVCYNLKNIVLLLIKNGVPVNTLSSEGMSALHRAVRHKLADLVLLLIENGADGNAPDQFGRTPLFYAASVGDLAILQLLLEKGANPHIRDHFGRTPLHYAAFQGHEPVLKFLIEDLQLAINQADHNTMRPLDFASIGSQEQACRYLASKGAESKKSGFYIFFLRQVLKRETRKPIQNSFP